MKTLTEMYDENVEKTVAVKNCSFIIGFVLMWVNVVEIGRCCGSWVVGCCLSIVRFIEFWLCWVLFI